MGGEHDLGRTARPTLPLCGSCSRRGSTCASHCWWLRPSRWGALPWLAGRRYEMRVAGEQSSLAECPWTASTVPCTRGSAYGIPRPALMNAGVL